ncbi:MAG: McrC family protein, partial [bacterium]
MATFITQEHKSFTPEDRRAIIDLKLDYFGYKKSIKFLGLSQDLVTSYYIGVDWLVEGTHSLMVKPKIEGLDYMAMFMKCLSFPEAINEMNETYHISFNKSPIDIDSSDFDITPILIIHFLKTVEKIVRQGLKKDYVIMEDNLKSKIKGKLVLTQHIKKNLLKSRYDTNYCRYQEYSIDCKENRILKKALRVISSYLNNQTKYKEDFIRIHHFCLAAFESVSDEGINHQTNHIKVSPFYRDYKEALNLAEMIFKRLGYDNANKTIHQKRFTPPFWINMAKLFEIYVFSLLREKYGKSIYFQSKGKYGYVDFLKIDEQLIIDTKYKLVYGNTEKKDGEYKIEDIRQLAGYSRDVNVRKKLNIFDENKVVDCIIIYPDKNSPERFEG